MDAVIAAFPSLDKTVLEITSPQTERYNCIAYAAGVTTKKWWPDKLRIGYWPEKAPRFEKIMAFQIAFETLGYELCDNDSLEEQIEKVAFFHNDGIPTHAAIQLKDGRWSSKLGDSFDISHDLKGLEGENYGTVALIMKRKT